MKQFYHFYVALNNMEDIDQITDVDDIGKIDRLWARLLKEARVELSEDEISELAGKIKQALG